MTDTETCQGDGVCTNPRCPRHGIEWTNGPVVTDEAVPRFPD